jgi:hypothetical protein
MFTAITQLIPGGGLFAKGLKLVNPFHFDDPVNDASLINRSRAEANRIINFEFQGLTRGFHEGFSKYQNLRTLRTPASNITTNIKIYGDIYDDKSMNRLVKKITNAQLEAQKRRERAPAFT